MEPLILARIPAPGPRAAVRGRPGPSAAAPGGRPARYPGTMPAPDDRSAAPRHRPAARSGIDALSAAALVLGLVCAACLTLLLVLKWAGADPWDGLTAIPWFAFPVAFLLLCASLVRSVLRRRRA
jgi:hypothetical protein